MDDAAVYGIQGQQDLVKTLIGAAPEIPDRDYPAGGGSFVPDAHQGQVCPVDGNGLLGEGPVEGFRQHEARNSYSFRMRHNVANNTQKVS